MTLTFYFSLFMVLTYFPSLSAQSIEQNSESQPIITATKTLNPKQQLPNAISSVASSDLENQKPQKLVDSLHFTPGINISNTSNPALQSALFIRGANSEHTLVLMDGIELNDPTLVGRSYDFSQLIPIEIDRIEILRGPQSVLYGSEGIGGVINIISKRGQGPTRYNFQSETGSYQSFREQASVSGSNTFTHYSLGISRFDSQGISAASKKYGNDEPDRYGNTTFATRIGVDQGKGYGIDFINRYLETKSELDLHGGFNGDDPNYQQKSIQNVYGVQGWREFFNNFWRPELKLATVLHKRFVHNQPDASHPIDTIDAAFLGKRYMTHLQNDFHLNKQNTFTIGWEQERELVGIHSTMISDFGTQDTNINNKTLNTLGIFCQHQIMIADLLTFNVGIRNDYYNTFGNQQTYRAGTLFWLAPNRLALKANIGTGFKAPTIYQQYSEFGNTDLQPEQSLGWDIGSQYSVFPNNRLMFELFYFRNQFTDLIDFDFSTAQYQNIAKAQSSGIELFISQQLMASYQLGVNATWMQTKDLLTGLPLLRRPERKYGASLKVLQLDPVISNIEYIYTGKRQDIDSNAPVFARTTLPAYALANFNISYFVHTSTELYFKILNLLNERYEDISGYDTLARSYYFGISLTF